MVTGVICVPHAQSKPRSAVSSHTERRREWRRSHMTLAVLRQEGRVK